MLLMDFLLCLSHRSRSACRPHAMEAGSVVRAVFDFCPSVSEELPLFVGDVIEVLDVVDEFWLLGKKEGVTGKPTPSSIDHIFCSGHLSWPSLCWRGMHFIKSFTGIHLGLRMQVPCHQSPASCTSKIQIAQLFFERSVLCHSSRQELCNTRC